MSGARPARLVGLCLLIGITLFIPPSGSLAALPQSSSAPALVPKPASKILYIMPNWLQFNSSSNETVAQETRQLRERIGEGRFVRVGFTIYIFISMGSWEVDTSSPSAVQAELASTIGQIDGAIAKARAANVPVCFSFLTATRERYDPAQAASERDDRRNMEWYWDNGLAKGWWTYSRYARKQRTVLRAYVQELAKILANRMAKYPATVVASTGDGEIEMSFDRAGPPLVLADYSPFAVMEFRDWLRQGGLYGPGQPFDGEGYEHGGRYAKDDSPAVDTNRDGHTLNADFGTTFASWDLRYFDWSLNDDMRGDPHSIPAMTYEAPGWNPLQDAGASRFDAPRRIQNTDYWSIWERFRRTMVWHYNVDFARWMTTTADPETGLTVPVERWFSEQIPADYLFGGTPENPNDRLLTSASPWWSADVSPYGSLGITAFNIDFGSFVARTLINVAPRVAERNVRWGVIEWHPGVPPSSPGSVSNSLDLYRSEMAVVERYKPALLVPVYWGDPFYQIQNTAFQVALRELVDRIKDNPR